MDKLNSTADDIITCACALIVQRGYDGFSYADIAAVVGIRKASIHHHFPSKQDLVRTLVAQYREEAHSGLAALSRSASDPHVQLTAYLAYWQACMSDQTRDFCICAILAADLPALPESVALEVRQHFKNLSSWLTGVLKQGSQTNALQLKDTPHCEAELFMASVHGAMMSARAMGDPKLFTIITNSALHRLTA